MLPSCGHFKNIPCPFYKLALCVRPHCPYKHQSSENGHQRQLFSPTVDETESLFDSKVNLKAILHKSSYHNSAVIETSENATYIPTPVDIISKPPGILKSSNSNFERASSSFVPEYKPTPISKLKEFSTSTVKSVKSEYSPEYPIAIKKKKNVEAYDPTEVKCIPKKSVTFVDQTDPVSSNIPCISLSSDDDLDDSESAPQFSDDDLEDDAPPVSNSTKQVPEVTVIKEENIIEEAKIDEYSVVDKILVDCKKNEIFLNSYQKLKLPPKTNDLPSKASSIQKQDKNKTVLSQKSEVKNNKNNSNVSVKIEKNVVNVTSTKADDRTSNIKPKPKKDENSDSISNASKAKSDKKESKTEKSETSKEKVHKSSSHSSHNKERPKKSSKESDKSKHSKKISSETKKSSSNDSKSSKSVSQSATEHLDKKNTKKKVHESHSRKHVDCTSSSDKKKSKSENNNLKSSESYAIKSKERNPSNKHTIVTKRKLDTSDSAQYSSKNKSSSDIKKFKSNHNVSIDTKKTKSDDFDLCQNKSEIDDQLSDLDMDYDTLNDVLSSSESDPDEECRRIFNECYPEDSKPAKEDKKEVTSQANASKTPELVILRKKRYAHPAAADLTKDS